MDLEMNGTALPTRYSVPNDKVCIELPDTFRVIPESLTLTGTIVSPKSGDFMGCKSSL